MEGSSTAPSRKCDRCAEVIGVYEPVVVVDDDGEARETSRAAEPSTAFSSGRRYHRPCYVRALEGDEAQGDSHPGKPVPG